MNIQEYRNLEVKPTPAVDMGVSINIGSDSYPATIIEIKTPKRIIIQSDAVIERANNLYTEDQKYTYFPDPCGEKFEYSLRKDGSWRIKGDTSGHYLTIGYRRKYRDPNF